MADLDPGDIKDPEEDAPPPPLKEPEHEPPDDEEEDEDEEKPDLAAVCEHLTIAVAELARASGSSPAILAAIEKARQALGR